MSNNFLNYGSETDLTVLQQGTFETNLATIQDQSLVPGLPVCANNSKRLITRLLGLADLNFVPGSSSLASAGGTTLVSDGVGPDLAIKGLTAGAGLELTPSATDITIASTDQPRITALEQVTTYVTSDGVSSQTDVAGGLSVTNGITAFARWTTTTYNQDTQSSGLDRSEGARWTFATEQVIYRIGIATAHWPTPSGPRGFRFWTDAGVLIQAYTVPRTTISDGGYVLDLSPPLTLAAGIYRYAVDCPPNVISSGPTTLFTFDPRITNQELAFTPGALGAFPTTVVAPGFLSVGTLYIADVVAAALTVGTARMLSPGTVEAPILKGTGAAPILLGASLDFSNVYELLRIGLINGIRPSGGVYSESSAVAIVGAQTNRSLIGLSPGFGSVSIPANSFQQGDSYSLKLGGSITCANNDSFLITVGASGAAPSTFATYTVTIDVALVSGWWELEHEFIIRQVGVAGIAVVSSNGNFSYVSSTGVVRGVGINTLQGTTFDTTVNNTLSITYTTAEVSITSFQPSQLILTKLY